MVHAKPTGAHMCILMHKSSTHNHTQVVHVAVEMAPIAKVGGMGDVVTALGRAVQEEGHAVEVSGLYRCPACGWCGVCLCTKVMLKQTNTQAYKTLTPVIPCRSSFPSMTASSTSR